MSGKMKLLGYFFLFLSTGALYSVSAETSQSDTPTPVVESTTATPATPSINSTTTEAGSNVTQSTDSSNGTSTAVPITTANVSTSTTESPATVTVIPVTTTEMPGPADLMLVVNNSGHACILAKMEITLTIQYTNENDSLVSGTFPIKNATVDQMKSSSCQDPTQDVVENMHADFNGKNFLNFVFNRTSADKFAVNLLELESTDLKSLFPDAKDNQTLTLHYDQIVFETSSNMSYKCNSETKVDLVNASGDATSNSILFKMVQVEAFHLSEEDNFSNAIDCEADDEISNIVPIAVGCALAGLVVIVLIAYLVGRRQKRQRGYESV